MADWVKLGDELVNAQRALGFSDERVARDIAVATRTWIRYRQAGRVPVHMVERVAEVLRIEIERPARRHVTIEEAATLDDAVAAVAAIDRKLDVDVVPRLAAIEAELRRLAEAVTAARPA